MMPDDFATLTYTANPGAWSKPFLCTEILGASDPISSLRKTYVVCQSNFRAKGDKDIPNLSTQFSEQRPIHLSPYNELKEKSTTSSGFRQYLFLES